MSKRESVAQPATPVLFLKSTVRRQVFVPTFTRGDGTVVEGHYAMVHVTADHDDARVLAGQGSYSQRQAHAQLSREDWFHRLPADHKVPVLMHRATAIQDAASASAALSGWRSRAHAGQNPTPAQWRAYHDLPSHRQFEMAHAAVTARGNGDHLRSPVLADMRRDPANPPAPSPQSAPAQAQVPTVPEPAPENPPQRVVAAAEVSRPRPARDVIRNPVIAPMVAVAVPRFMRNDEETNNARRQIQELRMHARRGEVDAIANYAVTRATQRSTRVYNYRLALLAAAQQLTPAQAAENMRGPIPAPPDITGANMQNTALLAARRKVQFLHAAAQSSDPVAAIMAITTSRGNRYLNAADDYKRALLAHFGTDVAGHPVVPAASVSPATPSSPSQQAVTPPAPATAPSALPDAQNPEVAANHLGLSEAQLGFVPRPNVPLDQRTNSPGFSHPDPRVMALNRRYLAQDGSLQSRAREYQARRWWPNTPEAQQARQAHERQQQRPQRQQPQRRQQQQISPTQSEAQMREIRAAAARLETNLRDMDDLFKPRNPVGANISSPPQLDAAVRVAIQHVLRLPSERAVALLSGMVADYDSPGMFSMAIRSEGANNLVVKFSKADGTTISRSFTRYANGNLVVSHSYFKAGRTGQGSGKHLFRVSMGIYKALDVKEVRVYANIDVGGYAWARFGYRASDWSELRETLLRRLDRLASTSVQVRPQASANGAQRAQRNGGLNPQERDAVRAVLNSPQDKALWALADMRIGERAIGKELLLGTSWPGVMPLSDAAVMRRFMKYVAPDNNRQR